MGTWNMIAQRRWTVVFHCWMATLGELNGTTVAGDDSNGEKGGAEKREVVERINHPQVSLLCGQKIDSNTYLKTSPSSSNPLPILTAECTVHPQGHKRLFAVNREPRLVDC